MAVDRNGSRPRVRGWGVEPWKALVLSEEAAVPATSGLKGMWVYVVRHLDFSR